MESLLSASQAASSPLLVVYWLCEASPTATFHNTVVDAANAHGYMNTSNGEDLILATVPK
jgi:hypothetical protein